MPRYPIAIVGPGALGLAFGERLSRRLRVALVARTERRAAEIRGGVAVGGTVFVPEAYGPASPPAADWVLLLVKAQHTRLAAATASRMAPLGVLSLQNGCIEEELHEALRDVPAAQGVTTAAAWRDGGEVWPTASGETLAPPGFEDLVGLMQGAGIRARIEPDIVQARMRKFLVNACLNPLTALHGIRNGLVCEPPYVDHLRMLAKEAAAILSAQRVDVDERSAMELVTGIARATAGNRSSMLQDVQAGRETEVEYLTAAMLKMAARHRIAAPAHEIVYRFLRGECTPAQAIRELGTAQLADAVG